MNPPAAIFKGILPELTIEQANSPKPKLYQKLLFDIL